MVHDYNLTVMQTKSGNHWCDCNLRLGKEYKKVNSDTTVINKKSYIDSNQVKKLFFISI